MSKLEELIKEFCPNGVEYKRISEFTKLLRGKRLTKSQLVENGKYAVYHGSLVPLGYYNEANRDSGVIIVNTGGIGGVGFSNTPFWCSDGCFCLDHSSKMVDKYVYYALVGFKDYLISRTRVGGVPTIDSDTVLSIKIPLPALPVQREIVRILDSFTLYSAELTAELTARRKQYEFYRDKLLNFESDSVEWKPIEELFPLIRNGFVGTVTPYFTEKENGVRYLEGTNIHNAVISDNEELYVTKEFHKKHIRNELKADDILMVQSGHIGDCAVVGKKYAGANCHALIIMSNGGACSSKFYVHYFHTYSGFKSLAPAITGGTIQHVLAGKIGKIKVPVPPMEVQERIVKVLDNFDAICSDLGIGLPAEIEKRQKQYEYYREKLLTFDGMYATILTERNGTERNGTGRAD